MVTELRDRGMDVESIVNIIQNANPNITIDSITRRGTNSPVVELTAVGETAQARDWSVNNLVNTLVGMYPGILIERISSGRVLSEEIEEESKKQVTPKRSAYGIR